MEKDMKALKDVDSANATLTLKNILWTLPYLSVMGLSLVDMCGAIDDSYDLMEIKDKGEILKGDMTDPNIAVHFMATFPYFDAMVRLYQEDAEFQKAVDEMKANA